MHRNPEQLHRPQHQRPQCVRLRAYLFTADGTEARPAADELNSLPRTSYSFHGVQRLSGDGSHYVFSSTECIQNPVGFEETKFPGVAFAPGGVTTGIGSAYDNDIENRSVTIVSKMPNGTDIQPDGDDTHGIEFPGLSSGRLPHPHADEGDQRPGPPLHAGGSERQLRHLAWSRRQVRRHDQGRVDGLLHHRGPAHRRTTTTRAPTSTCGRRQATS